MARNRRQATKHGYVIINKPHGWTSHDVVAKARRIVGERRIGHAGTLDPAATGVLPLAVGLATRTVEYLAEADKAYRATVRFGIVTDSADAEGDVTSQTDVSALTFEDIEPHLDAFRGEIMQVPPAHSAIKVDGRRLYELARKGEDVVVPARQVTIHDLSVVSWNAPDLVLDITCSKGTYIRSIARDLGDTVGVGAHLAALERTRTGPFGLDAALSLDELQARLESDGWDAIAQPADTVLAGRPALSLNEQDALHWQQGKRWSVADQGFQSGIVRAYDSGGNWLGVGEIDSDLVLKPVKVVPVEFQSTVSETQTSPFPVKLEGPHVVSIGTFDGVHLGHQYLLSQSAKRAAELGVPLVAVTFEPYPAQVIRPDAFAGRLVTAQDKLAKLWASGVDQVIVVPFTQELMLESPETFLAQLVEATHPLEVWVGEAFALGHKRVGDVTRLKEIGSEMGFALVAVARREVGGDVVSSSRIRKLILEGALDQAEALLGYPFRIAGEVIRGAQIGRTIGFPTANVEPPVQMVPVPDGIYATLAMVEGDEKCHWAMTYIGTRPALNTGSRQIETHLLDFSGDLYGKTLTTDFIARLRPDANFPGVDALVAQLKLDESDARSVLASSTGSSTN